VRTNLILADSVEREYSTDAGVEMVPLGLYMIKGDNVYVVVLCTRRIDVFCWHSSALVAEIDEEKDSTIDYTTIRAEPIAEIRHWR
jgi:U6 snRNA-associated Sm-like protein LSm8